MSDLDLLEFRVAAHDTTLIDIKDTLRAIAESLSKQVATEQQLIQVAGALERAFGALEKVEQRVAVLERQAWQTPERLSERLRALELQAPEHGRVRAWVDRAVMACAGGAVVFVAIRALG